MELEPDDMHLYYGNLIPDNRKEIIAVLRKFASEPQNRNNYDTSKIRFRMVEVPEIRFRACAFDKGELLDSGSSASTFA